MWIIVEGPTVSGKSTLVEVLSKRLTGQDVELKTVHMERPAEQTRRWVLNEYANKWQWYNGQDTILADRWHWGEATYAPIYRPNTNKDGYGLLGKAGWRWVELFLMSRGAVTVQVTAHSDELVRRLTERGDDHVQNDDELRKVAQLYEDHSSGSPTTSFIYNTQSGTPVEQVAIRVIQLAELHREYVRQLFRFPGYIGARKPAVLLLGDRRNITKRYGVETNLPFMPVDGNSGEYLLSALPENDWKQIGIANACEQADLHMLWTTLGCPPIAALGNNAALAAKKAGLSAVTFNHPQHMRRFKNSEQEEYGKYILMDTLRG